MLLDVNSHTCQSRIAQLYNWFKSSTVLLPLVYKPQVGNECEEECRIKLGPNAGHGLL